MMTARRIEKVKTALATDDHFWWDMLDRHGLRNTALCALEPEVREHAVGNFWGQLCTAWHRLQNASHDGRRPRRTVDGVVVGD
jgi:hypothetical protein